MVQLIAPNFFGDALDFSNWGPEHEDYYWEVMLSIGAIGFLLAIYGAFRGQRENRMRFLIVAGVLVIIALGPVHTGTPIALPAHARI